MIKKVENSEDLTLKTLMDAVPITEPELSKRIGASVPSIAAWKARRKIPRIDNAAALARELDVSLKTLFRALGIDVTGIPNDE